MNVAPVSGLLAVICATTFFMRWAMSDAAAVAWPKACFATRLFLFSMGLVFAARGLSLLRGSATIDAGGTLALAVFTGYSLAMAIRELKNMPPRTRGRRPVGQPPISDRARAAP